MNIISNSAGSIRFPSEHLWRKHRWKFVSHRFHASCPYCHAAIVQIPLLISAACSIGGERLFRSHDFWCHTCSDVFASLSSAACDTPAWASFTLIPPSVRVSVPSFVSILFSFALFFPPHVSLNAPQWRRSGWRPWNIKTFSFHACVCLGVQTQPSALLPFEPKGFSWCINMIRCPCS